MYVQDPETPYWEEGDLTCVINKDDSSIWIPTWGPLGAEAEYPVITLSTQNVVCPCAEDTDDSPVAVDAGVPTCPASDGVQYHGRYNAIPITLATRYAHHLLRNWSPLSTRVIHLRPVLASPRSPAHNNAPSRIPCCRTRILPIQRFIPSSKSRTLHLVLRQAQIFSSMTGLRVLLLGIAPSLQAPMIQTLMDFSKEAPRKATSIGQRFWREIRSNC